MTAPPSSWMTCERALYKAQGLTQVGSLRKFLNIIFDTNEGSSLGLRRTDPRLQFFCVVQRKAIDMQTPPPLITQLPPYSGLSFPVPQGETNHPPHLLDP